MNSTPESIAFDKAINPLLQIVLPGKAQELANFTPEPWLEERIVELAEKSNEGELSKEERAEYEGYVRANKIAAIFQRHARRALSTSS